MNATPYGTSGGGETIVAMFRDRSQAHEALADLHDAGFRNVWLGVTHGDASAAEGATVASESGSGGGFMNSVGRFFSGEGASEQALHQALIARGVTDEQARRLEATVPSGTAIVTVDGENNAGEAMQIVGAYGGEVVGSAGSRSSGATQASTAAVADDMDEARRLQLREERLSVDKQRVSSGEALIRKDVVTEQQSIDVPVFHEELFIARHPVAEGTATSTTPIGAGEEIRIPLSEERVDVQKRMVVTEEVEVGKRTVTGTEHVSEAVRREQLRVEDDTNADDTRQTPKR